MSLFGFLWKEGGREGRREGERMILSFPRMKEGGRERGREEGRVRRKSVLVF